MNVPSILHVGFCNFDSKRNQRKQLKQGTASSVLMGTIPSAKMFVLESWLT